MGEPNQQRNLNKLTTEIFANNHRLSMQVGAKLANAKFPLSFHFAYHRWWLGCGSLLSDCSTAAATKHVPDNDATQDLEDAHIFFAITSSNFQQAHQKKKTFCPSPPKTILCVAAPAKRREREHFQKLPLSPLLVLLLLLLRFWCEAAGYAIPRVILKLARGREF